MKRKTAYMLKIIKWLLLALISLLIVTLVNFQIKNKKMIKNFKLTEFNESFKLIKKRFGNPDRIRVSDNIFIAVYYDSSLIIGNGYYFKFSKPDSLLISKVID